VLEVYAGKRERGLNRLELGVFWAGRRWLGGLVYS
jgi:hypothetical protein